MTVNRRAKTKEALYSDVRMRTVLHVRVDIQGICKQSISKVIKQSLILFFQMSSVDKTALYRLKNLNNHNVISVYKDQFKIGRATGKYSIIEDMIG